MRVPLKSRAWLFVAVSLAVIAVGAWHEWKARIDAASEAVRPAGRAPAWVVDPASSGESLPSVGRSLFDFLVLSGGSTQVPFPFEALTRTIDARSGCDAAGASCLKSVLIPLGRSLQRSSAAPEFFAYPRAVVAVDAEPSGKAPLGNRRLLLKDRLYLGYQERADLIEVISYNEAAGRFEFQLVKDYRAGATPKVVYANRAVCTACHQNHAPLFSRQVWDETNANPRVAALLLAQKRKFYGIPVARGVDIPNALDDATERANLFSVYQKLWSEGCEERGDGRKSSRCRAAALQALIQYRLSDERGFDQDAPAYRENLLAVLDRSGKALWPFGLAIPNPDIPNRDPLAGAAVDDLRKASLAHVPMRFEALVPREPLEIWRADAAENARRMIAGLSAFVSSEDVRRLDAHLFDLGSKPGKPRRGLSGECGFAFSNSSGSAQRLEFRCPGREGEGGALSLSGRLELPVGKAATGTVERLSTAENESGIGDFELRANRMEWRGEYTILVLRPARRGLHVRLTDGNAIDTITLRWRPASAAEVQGEASIDVLEDFAPVSAAIAQLTESEGAGPDPLGSRVFRRAAVLPELFSRLGVPEEPSCCLDGAGLPPARLDAGEPAMQAPPADAMAFYQYCALCHQTPERSPPNFLYGDAGTVAANLRHCAERIYFRLSMWQLRSDDRPKTPMPPAMALKQFNVEPDHWPASPELAGLKRYVAGLMQERPERLLNGEYENLRGCLPSL